MTWMITGAGGQVGQCLQQALKQSRRRIIALSHSALDITNETLLLRVLEASKPQVVFNCAAYTHLDKAEQQPERAWSVNAKAPSALARWCNDNDAWLIHLSSDYVFSGWMADAYSESALPCPLSEYGRSKLAGEQAIMETCTKAIVIRTGWLFSQYGKNPLCCMLNSAQKSLKINVASDAYVSPTPAVALAEAMLEIANLAEQGRIAKGRYHFAGTPTASTYVFAGEMLRQANELGLVDHSCRLLPETINPPGSGAMRPHNSALVSQKLPDLGIYPPDWRTELSATLEAIKDRQVLGEPGLCQAFAS
jgi:dTDP-4-dehydrorhamnose reductase